MGFWQRRVNLAQEVDAVKQGGEEVELKSSSQGIAQLMLDGKIVSRYLASFRFGDPCISKLSVCVGKMSNNQLSFEIGQTLVVR